MTKIYTVGGYNEVGKNMTIVDVGKDAFIFDAGFFLPAIVKLQEQEKQKYTEEKLRRISAIPNDLVLNNETRRRIRAMFIGHAHLDHIGAIPYIEGRYNADILATPYTAEVIKTILKDENLKLRNQLKAIQPNSSFTVRGAKEYKVEFLNITHSTLQTSLIALHTDDGIILYANDFKFDNSPILGKKPNYEAIRRIAKKGIKALIVDSLYAGEDRKTPSEKIARGLLEDVLLTTHNEKSGIIVTTFSSHIARLKSIVDFGKQLKRKVIFLGRSLSKYVNAAKQTKLCPFYKDIIIATYKKQVGSILKKISRNRRSYMLVCTGHQGEPGSILDRLAKNELPFEIMPNDHVIFSSKTIPAPVNEENKNHLLKRIKSRQARIFDDVHVSGHACREDLRDFINMTQPQHIFPAHGDFKKLSALAELASELGYKIGKDCHIMQDMQNINI